MTKSRKLNPITLLLAVMLAFALLFATSVLSVARAEEPEEGDQWLIGDTFEHSDTIYIYNVAAPEYPVEYSSDYSTLDYCWGNASLKVEDDIMEYITDPELIYEQYADKVDMVIDGGNGDYVPSTVLNCVGGTVELIRQGKGVVDFL